MEDQLIVNAIESRATLKRRYRLESLIGKGHFAWVVKAYDSTDQVHVAIKVPTCQYLNQAVREINLLHMLNVADPADSTNVVRVLDAFSWKDRSCMVMELLAWDLYSLRKSYPAGLPLAAVRSIGRQICTALKFLAQHQVIHADLKPPNVLLREPSLEGTVKLVDFGNAIHLGHFTTYGYAQTRFYRAPEVILGLNYGIPVDVWSLGCILVELLTGQVLFPGLSEFEQMRMIVELLGRPPRHLLDSAPKTGHFFYRDGAFRAPLAGAARCIPVTDCSPAGSVAHVNFHDVTLRMLEYDPARRITPAEALEHPFFKQTTPAQ